jgi:hypothetical protein
LDKYLTIRVPRRLVKAALVLTIVGAVIAPIAVSASHQFTDVPDTEIFHDNIAWLADADITRGCNPPTNDQFCPDDNVTRGQMAAFMQRLAEAKVVDAATAVTAESATTADSATTAGDSDTLDGLDGNELSRVAYAVSTGNAFVGDGLTSGTILTTSITAPIDGFLIMSASSDVFSNSADDRMGCRLEIDGTVVPSSRRTFMINFTAGVNQEEDCHSETVVPVMTGDHTIDFVTNGTPAAGIVYDESALWVLFVPFDGAGNPPTDFTINSSRETETANN